MQCADETTDKRERERVRYDACDEIKTQCDETDKRERAMVHDGCALYLIE